jgi:uncharacterized membrane protein YeaQ/YmgE (transglycosylase-associated protein family)
LAIGVAGSILGGWLGDFFFRAHEGPFQPAGLIGSLMGAVLLLLLVRQFRKPSERS